MRGSDFAELKAFISVVERQSFARAAEHLGLSPSALSQTIRQLESRIGARLLNRTTRSVAPSSSGEQLYRRQEELRAAILRQGNTRPPNSLTRCTGQGSTLGFEKIWLL